jgi:fructose-bisphosphate aldolase, class II
MALISIKEILKDAESRKYAVGCYNALNLEMTRGVIQAAEEEKSPVIICHAEVHFKYMPLESIAPVMLNEAKKAKVPVAVLLDHGKSFAAVIKAMHLGFNSIMFDASELPYEENVKKTAEIVKIAKELGVSVEAELGHVTRPKGGGTGGEEEEEALDAMDNKSNYTDPAKAREYIERTGIDALAPAFGTAHGVYLKKPQLDIERLVQIKSNSCVPLVMHGGSGLANEDFRNAIKNGISKINYYTGMSLNASASIKQKLMDSDGMTGYHQVIAWAMEAVREDVKVTMRLFASSNKA